MQFSKKAVQTAEKAPNSKNKKAPPMFDIVRDSVWELLVWKRIRFNRKHQAFAVYV